MRELLYVMLWYGQTWSRLGPDWRRASCVAQPQDGMVIFPDANTYDFPLQFWNVFIFLPCLRCGMDVPDWQQRNAGYHNLGACFQIMMMLLYLKKPKQSYEFSLAWHPCIPWGQLISSYVCWLAVISMCHCFHKPDIGKGSHGKARVRFRTLRLMAKWSKVLFGCMHLKSRIAHQRALKYFQKWPHRSADVYSLA